MKLTIELTETHNKLEKERKVNENLSKTIDALKADL